jgi:two-component system chemotaxis response regulator CheB
MSRHLPPSIVLIGASTGGTRVLPEILSRLPLLPACIVIVQHMPKFINESLARSLAKNTPAKVRLAQDGDSLAEGLILLAPSGVHCRLIRNRNLCLAPGEPVNFVCPSIDVLMRSAQPPAGQQRLIGVLLTGMGNDGAAGLLHIKTLGGLTMAQNQASCAVYGMPAVAARLGCVDYELPPVEIARRLEAITLRQGNQNFALTSGSAGAKSWADARDRW